MDSQGNKKDLEERNRLLRGYAKIGLEHLDFKRPLYGARAFDQKNVDRLARVFELEECSRLELGHYITAVIDDGTLQQAMNLSGVSVEDIKDPTNLPWLTLPGNFQISCLYGIHRIAAAKQILLPGDQWWSVILYNDGLSEHLKNRLLGDPNAKEFGQGDIFRNLRYSQLFHDDESIGIWKSRMSRRRDNDLERLSRKYPIIVKHLDRLLPFAGLWTDLSFTALRRLSRIKCPTEIIHYIDRIYLTWSTLFPERLSQSVDAMSVRQIQNLMPQQSTADSSLIHGLMDDGHLFPLVVDLEQRDSLLQRLLKISGRILSLHSLAQDTLLLEPCAKSLHQLVPGSYANLRHSLLSHFNGGGTDWPIQTAENVTEDVTVDYGNCPALYQSKQAFSAYVQLWLFAIRYIESLTDTKLAGSRDDNHNKSPHMYRPAKREAIRRLAFLAHRLRFRSKQIEPLRLQNTMKSVTRDFIVTCRPPQLYEYPSKWETDTTNKVVQILNVPRVRNDCTNAIPPFSVEDQSNAPYTRERCGLPSSKAHRDNCQSLYIPQIYSPDQPTGTYPSTFAIMRDIFCSFFGLDLFPPDFRFPWWTASVASSPTTESVLHDPVDLTLPEEIDHVSPIDLEPHPPGTPMHSNESQEQLETGCQSLTSDIDMPEALVTQPPMAAGFEDEYGVAELNLRAYISHNRGAKEILTLWAQSQNTRLVVFYFFKIREYCKFDIGDREMRAHLRSFVYSIANDHHFATIDEDSLVSISAAQAVEANPGHVVFISTDLEHNEPPTIHLWQYILSFDPKTGKREGDGKDERPKKKGHLSEEL